MKFVNKWYIGIWILLLVASAVFAFMAMGSIACLQNVQYDEEKMMKECGVTVQAREIQRKSRLVPGWEGSHWISEVPFTL